jgi:hypothetical protein
MMAVGFKPAGCEHIDADGRTKVGRAAPGIDLGNERCNG